MTIRDDDGHMMRQVMRQGSPNWEEHMQLRRRIEVLEQYQTGAYGCICPPTCEKTCMSPMCPRRGCALETGGIGGCPIGNGVVDGGGCGGDV